VQPGVSLTAVQNREAPFDEKKLVALICWVFCAASERGISGFARPYRGLENRIFSAIRQATSLEEIHTLSKANATRPPDPPCRDGGVFGDGQRVGRGFAAF
jgi:hypothetical protein